MKIDAPAGPGVHNDLRVGQVGNLRAIGPIALAWGRTITRQMPQTSDGHATLVASRQQIMQNSLIPLV